MFVGILGVGNRAEYAGGQRWGAWVWTVYGGDMATGPLMCAECTESDPRTTSVGADTLHRDEAPSSRY